MIPTDGRIVIWTNGGSPETINGGQGQDVNHDPVSGYETMDDRATIAAIRAQPTLPVRYVPGP